MRLSLRSLHRPRLAARNPARLRVDPRQYSRCFPKLRREILLSVAYLCFVLAVLPLAPRLWPLLFAPLPLIGPYVRRAANVRRHFNEGDVNAAKVLDPQTGLIAAFADLGTHSGVFYPTVRLLHYPLGDMSKASFASGDGLPAISVYTGVPGGHKWDGFNPIPAACATTDQGELTRLHDAVPEWQWMFLNEALFHIPRPYRAGIYPVGEFQTIEES